MQCPKCGAANQDNAQFCSKCGNPLPSAAPPPPPHATGQQTGGYYAQNQQDIPNHLVWAILATIFCCIPAGIVSIVYAAQVNGKKQAGDIQGAMQASRNAKTWAWVSFGLGLGVTILYLLLTVAGGVAGGY